MDDYNFPIAFGIEGYLDGKPRTDPIYVEWVVLLAVKTSAGTEEIPLSIHLCNETDYDSFNKPGLSSEQSFAHAKATSSMFCLDRG